MTGIGPIDGIGRYEGIVPPSENSESRQPQETKPQAQSSDAVTISAEGRFHAYLKALDEAPETRENVVQKAKDRVQSGYYDRPEVRLAAAAALLDAGLISLSDA